MKTYLLVGAWAAATVAHAADAPTPAQCTPALLTNGKTASATSANVSQNNMTDSTTIINDGHIDSAAVEENQAISSPDSGPTNRAPFPILRITGSHSHIIMSHNVIVGYDGVDNQGQDNTIDANHNVIVGNSCNPNLTPAKVTPTPP